MLMKPCFFLVLSLGQPETKASTSSCAQSRISSYPLALVVSRFGAGGLALVSCSLLTRFASLNIVGSIFDGLGVATFTGGVVGSLGLVGAIWACMVSLSEL